MPQKEPRGKMANLAPPLRRRRAQGQVEPSHVRGRTGPIAPRHGPAYARATFLEWRAGYQRLIRTRGNWNAAPSPI